MSIKYSVFEHSKSCKILLFKADTVVYKVRNDIRAIGLEEKCAAFIVLLIDVVSRYFNQELRKFLKRAALWTAVLPCPSLSWTKQA